MRLTVISAGLPRAPDARRSACGDSVRPRDEACLRKAGPAFKALGALLLWAAALPAPAINLPPGKPEGAKPPDVSPKAPCNTSPKAECNTREPGKPECLSLRIRFGRMPHAPELSPGYLGLEHDRPTPRMYTPQGLAYRLYAFSSVRGYGRTADASLAPKDASEGPVAWPEAHAYVSVDQANGSALTYRFAPGASVAEPVGRATGIPNRLQRLDASGTPVTNAAAAVYFDHWYSDGSRARLSVTNLASVSVTTAAGRAVTPAGCGVTAAYDAAGGLRQVWSAADGLADVAVVESNAVYEVRLYAPGDAGAATNAAGLRAVSGGHCDECLKRSGQVKTLLEWLRAGAPPCRCKCSLAEVGADAGEAGGGRLANTGWTDEARAASLAVRQAKAAARSSGGKASGPAYDPRYGWLTTMTDGIATWQAYSPVRTDGDVVVSKRGVAQSGRDVFAWLNGGWRRIGSTDAVTVDADGNLRLNEKFGVNMVLGGADDLASGNSITGYGGFRGLYAMGDGMWALTGNNLVSLEDGRLWYQPRRASLPPG